MPARDEDCTPLDSVEDEAYMIQDTGVETQTKVDELIATAAEVKVALSRRSNWIAAGVIVPLVVGAILMWNVNDSAMKAEQIAKQAYVQALRNNRTALVNQRTFAQTRDCPVEYFRELLRVNRERGDLTAIKPPCDPIDINAIEAQIKIVEARLRAAER